MNFDFEKQNSKYPYKCRKSRQRVESAYKNTMPTFYQKIPPNSNDKKIGICLEYLYFYDLLCIAKYF